MLTVEEYNRKESAAATAMPNRVVELVSPIMFASEGYPMRVRSEVELWKYLDVMHETRFERDFATLFGGGLTEQEFGLLQRVAQLACDFSKASFGRNLTTRGSLLRALNIYRHINNIFSDSPARVCEIGPGSGYLGCLFIQNGWSYAATDITQAFYLMQNHLWSFASGGRAKELVADADWDRSLSPNQPVHIPWWEFYELLDKGTPAVDVVTCNHVLAEMHPNSMAFVLRVAHEMLRGKGLKAFVFEGWGYEKFVPRSTITKEFYRSGFRLVHNDEQITVFVPGNAECALPSANLPRFSFLRGSALGRAGGAKSPATQPGKFARNVSALKAVMGSLDFLSGLKRLSSSLAYWPPQLSLPMNTVSERIVLERHRRGTEPLVRIEQVHEFYTKLLDSTDIRSADERFLELIGTSY